MKRLIVCVTVCFLTVAAAFPVAFNVPQVAVSSQKAMDAGWWGYKAIAELAAESGQVLFVENAPLSVAEIKTYLQKIDYERLSDSSKHVFDSIIDEFKHTGIAFKSDVVTMSAGLYLNPELYYKSNENIDWSFTYFYKDNLATAPLSIDIFDTCLIESDLFVGKNYWASQEADNFTNIPLGYNDFEFLFPTKAYFSTGKKFTESSGISFIAGKSPLSIGMAETGSVILSQFYEADFFAKLAFYSPKFRYELTTIQQEVNKYFYLHHLEVQPFKCVQFGIVEGMFINAPFELRFLNPLMLMHQLAPWTSYGGYNNSTSDGVFKFYGESRVCAYIGATFDWTPCKNLRVYGLYAQNEIQSISELQGSRGQMFPNSLGGQLGADYTIPTNKQGCWKIAVEGLYTTPWLYIKHDPDWSLFRARQDNLNNDGPICTWVGTQLGPDSIAAEGKFGYDSGRKWSANVVYSFIVKGENSFNLFYKNGTWEPNNYNEAEDEYTYYPVAGYDAKVYTEEEAIEIARKRMTPTGTPEYSNTVAVNFSYALLDWVTLSGKASYTAVINCNHVVDNFQQGVEFALSTKIMLLK